MLSTMVESEPSRLDPSQLTIGTRTWPRAHLSQRSLSDLQYRIRLEKAIKLARQNLEKQKQIGEQMATVVGTYSQITLRLLRALERIRETQNEQMLRRAGRRKRRQSSVASSEAAARREPHFGSMILFGTLQREEGKAMLQQMQQREMAIRRGASTRRKSISILSDDVQTEEGEEGAEGIVLPEQIAMEEEEEEPLLLWLFPLLISLLFAVLLLVVGALFFQLIDTEIGAQPFHRALLFCFQAVGTIGWGDVRASNKWSQAFCTLYTIFGVPMFFSALANVGRLISDFYTIDWLYLTCVVRPPSADDADVQQQHVPMRKSLYLLCIHLFVGLLLYGGLLKEYPVISVVYFCITSTATIGIGDFHPDARNLGEAAVAIVFMGIGMILLAALFIAFAYYIQVLFFVHFRAWLIRKSNERK